MERDAAGATLLFVRLMAAGFWEGPPILPSWVVAAACGVLGARQEHRRRAMPAADAGVLRR